MFSFSPCLALQDWIWLHCQLKNKLILLVDNAFSRLYLEAPDYTHIFERIFACFLVFTDCEVQASNARAKKQNLLPVLEAEHDTELKKLTFLVFPNDPIKRVSLSDYWRVTVAKVSPILNNV